VLSYVIDVFMIIYHCTARKLHALKIDNIFLKLDITKAFDIVGWVFLLEVLAKLGFDYKWLSIFYGLLGSVSTRVVVNGMAGG
jgi:hypothetical protein